MLHGGRTDRSERPEVGAGLRWLGLCLLVGSVIPPVVWSIDLYHQGSPLTWGSISQLHQVNPLHWIIDAIPLLLGSLGWLIGYQQQRMIKLQQHEAAAERVSGLQSVMIELSQAVTPAEVAVVIVEQGIVSIGGFASHLRLISADGDWLELVHTYNTPPEFARDWPSLPLAAPTVPSEALRSRRPVVVPSRECLRRSDPERHQSLPHFACDGTTVVAPLIAGDRSIGMLSLDFDRMVTIDDEALAMVESLATQGAQALERARLYEAAQQARTHDAFLAEAGRLLTGSLDYQTTLTTVAQLTIPSLADSCIIDLVGGDGVLRPLVILHRDQTKVELIKEMRRRYPVRSGTTNPIAWVMQTGQSWFEPEIRDERLLATCDDEGHVAAIKQLGYRSAIVVPLVVREQILGAMSLRLGESARRFTADDLALIEELALRAAQAIDNARLFDAEQVARRSAERAVDRMARLQEVTASLGDALTTERVAQILASQSRATLGATQASLLVLDADGHAFDLTGPAEPQLDQPMPPSWPGHAMDLTARQLALEALQRGEPLWLDGEELLAEPEATARPVAATSAAGAIAVLPLILNNRQYGVLILRSDDVSRFDDDDRSFLRSLVGQAAQTLARIRLVEAERQAQAEAAQRASETRFRSLVQHSSDLISIIDADLTLHEVTPSIERILGYRPADLIGQGLTALCHPADQPSLWQAVADVVAEPAAQGVVVWRMRHQHGHWCYVETMITNLLDDQAVNGLVLNTRDISEHKALEEQLTHQAFHDSLTGLANRPLFHNRLHQALLNAGRTGLPVTVLFLDLDNFKTINDSFGHSEGDRLLQLVAQRLTSCLREIDTVARLGGDEFAVLVEQTTPTEVVSLCERLGSILRQPLRLGQTDIVVGTSIGVAHSEIGQRSVDDLLRNADLAMYIAKSRGKGNYAIFEPNMHTAVLERLALEADLRQAIEQQQLVLHYQPIINLATGDLTGVEALLRWQHPQQGLIPPPRFISIAEETGLIRPIGRWALGEACRQVRLWQTQSELAVADLNVSVNVSGRQFQSPQLVEEVSEALAASGLAATCLTLEITESTVMYDTVSTIRSLTALRQLGVRLAIDDFGTGYSSLHYLTRFPIDVLKIDKAFVDVIDQAGGDSGVTRLIVQLGETLGLITVAEGIERREQLEQLLQLGCQHGQGYLFTRPVDAPTLGELLRQPAWQSTWPSSGTAGVLLLPTADRRDLA